jgi:ATP-dependent Clp protease adaptor protein ClpS
MGAATDSIDIAQETARGIRVRPAPRTRPKQQPRYNVVLIDDDEHTYDYVIDMLKAVFGYPIERGFQLAREVDSTGRVILLTTTLEHAELKRDQIHGFGADPLLARSRGSMTAVLEPVE